MPSLLKNTVALVVHSIAVVHDELTLASGGAEGFEYSKGAGGHNGVKSIMAALSTPSYKSKNRHWSESPTRAKVPIRAMFYLSFHQDGIRNYLR